MTDEKKVDAEAVDKTLVAAGATLAAAGTAMSAIGCLLMLPFLIGAVVLFGVVLWVVIFG